MNAPENIGSAAQALVLSAFANQDRLNRILADDWATKGWPYFRAIWREAAEGFDHIAWEWWKNADPTAPISTSQRQQIAIELADMLHFGLSSDIVQYKGDLTEISLYYVRCFDLAQATRTDLEDQLELLIVDAILCKSFNVKKFSRACKALGLGLTELMGYYFGKTALNEFRWANGYKEKTYKKMWRLTNDSPAVEDNIFLAQTVESVVAAYPSIEAFAEACRNGLYVGNVKALMQQTYNQVV